MGSLVAYTAIGGQKVTLANAQQKQNSPSQGQPQAPLPTHRFEIPPGVLGDVLDSFHGVTGLEITVANPGIRNVSSPGVSGVFTNEQALQHLLVGTGATYRFTGPTAVSLDLAAVQQSVTVNASALDAEQDQVASAKYALPILDTPQSVSVVPQQIMSEQNTTTLRDALRNVAGISLAAGEGSSQGDNLTIRGFTARNDIFLDGMRDFGSYYRDTFNQEEVQVLEGPVGDHLRPRHDRRRRQRSQQVSRDAAVHSGQRHRRQRSHAPRALWTSTSPCRNSAPAPPSA